MTPKDQQCYEAGVLIGQIESALDFQFFSFAMQGDMAASTSAAAQAALALHAARRGGLTSAQLQDAALCHNELLGAIRGGLSLGQALRQTRKQEPARSAFARLQEAVAEKLGNAA